MQIQGVPFDELRLGLLLACSSVRVSSPFIFVKRDSCRSGVGKKGDRKKKKKKKKLPRREVGTRNDNRIWYQMATNRNARLSFVGEKKKKIKKK